MTVRASIDPPEIPAGHDAKGAGTLTVTNADDRDRDLTLRVTGPAAAWAWMVPATLHVPAGGEGTARVVFQPPRAAEPTAGPMAFTVSIADATPGAEPVSVTGVVRVVPYVDLFASLHASASSGDVERHTLTVENRANAVVSARLEVAIRTVNDGPTAGAAGIAIGIEPSTISVDPGGTAEAEVTVVGGPASRGGAPAAFDVVIRPGDGPTTTVGGRLRAAPATSPRRTRVAVAAVVLLGAGVGLRATVLAPPDDSADTSSAAEEAAACPAEGRLGNATHGGAEPLPATGYTFLSAMDPEGCLPSRFNPCEPVPWVLNDELAPVGGPDDVREAFAHLQEATGITFVEEGTTDEPLAISRDPYQPDRYGERWAPILVGWSALGADQADGGDDVIVVGRGRPLKVDDVIVSGVLELNTDAIIDRATEAPLPAGFGPGITQGRVILHELGHVAGLGHVSGTAQLMYPDLAEHTSETADFGIGDLAGLRLLGDDAGCVAVPPLPGSAD